MAEEEDNVGGSGEAEAKPQKASVPWIPLVLVLLFIPIITLILVDFIVVPKLRKSLSAPHSEEAAAAEEYVVAEKASGHGGGHGAPAAEAPASRNAYTFEDIISNVSGTMGTRFLKVSFQILGEGSADLKAKVKRDEAKVRDAIISTLSSKTISDIEAVGGRNSMRISLISAINGALGETLVVELFFIDFVIQ